MTSSSDSSGLYTSTVQSAFPLLMLHFRPTLLQTSYPPSAHFVSSPSAPCSWLFFYALCFRLLLTPFGFFNGMLAVFKPGALNCFNCFCPILLTLSASRNSILTHLPLSESLDSLLCGLIAPTSGLAFSLMMPRTLAVVSSFSSGRAYLSLNFLPSLFLRLIPALIM